VSVTEPKTITIRIEELTIEGLAQSQWRRVQDALQRELERLATRYEFPAQTDERVTLDDVDMGDIELHPGVTPQEIGRRIARALFDQVTGGVR
jgi:hypothetical protein